MSKHLRYPSFQNPLRPSSVLTFSPLSLISTSPRLQDTILHNACSCRSSRLTSSVSFHGRSHCPITAALPPLPTIVSISIAASSPILPASVINSPFSFLLAALLTNLALLPSQPSIYAPITHLAPYAVVLLLLSPVPTISDPSRPSPFLRLFSAFLVAAFATFAAVLTASAVLLALPLPRLSQLPALAAALTATYIGGSLNFLAVAHTLRLSSQLAATAIAADLVAMALYIAALFYLAHRLTSSKLPTPSVDQPSERKSDYRLLSSIFTLPIPLCFAFALVSLSSTIVRIINFPSSTALVLASFLAAILSRISIFRPLFSATPIAATFALNLFFASLGASAHLPTILTTSPLILMYALVILFFHALFLYIIGSRLLRIDASLLLVASNANIGGATTAPAYAAACGWHQYVTPAIIVATLGYFLATPAAFVVHTLLSYLTK